MNAEKILKILSDCKINKEELFISDSIEDIENKIVSQIPYGNYSFYAVSGATKLCLIFENEKLVIKIPFNATYDYMENKIVKFRNANYYNILLESWDYCSKEVEYYNRAKKWGLEEVFLENKKIGFVNGYPIYMQQKAEFKYEETEIEWWTNCEEHYGKKFYSKLIGFLSSWHIEDLHSHNLGYYNDRPVIIDYAGYNE